jgi:hypothetical protein
VLAFPLLNAFPDPRGKAAELVFIYFHVFDYPDSHPGKTEVVDSQAVLCDDRAHIVGLSPAGKFIHCRNQGHGVAERLYVYLLFYRSFLPASVVPRVDCTFLLLFNEELDKTKVHDTGFTYLHNWFVSLFGLDGI